VSVSTSAPKKDKKFIAVRSDLLQKIMEISNRKGKSFYGFVNEIFEQAIKAEESNTSLAEVVEFYDLMESMKKAGATVTRRDVFNYAQQRLYAKEKDTLIEKWYHSGVWYGRYLDTKFNDAVDSFKKILSTCFWEITEVELISKEDGSVSLRILVPTHSHENTELLSKFIQGVMNALSYRLVKEEFWEGIIILNMVKRGKIPDMELDSI
jgi:hypothetical protein